MGFARDALLAEFAGRPGSRLVKKAGAMALVRDGRTARHIGPLFADSPDEALALVQAIVRSERGPLLLDAVHSQSRISRRPHRLRLEHRAAVPAHALRQRQHSSH